MSDIKKIKDEFLNKLDSDLNIEILNQIKTELFGKNGKISNSFKSEILPSLIFIFYVLHMKNKTNFEVFIIFSVKKITLSVNRKTDSYLIFQEETFFENSSMDLSFKKLDFFLILGPWKSPKKPGAPPNSTQKPGTYFCI